MGRYVAEIGFLILKPRITLSMYPNSNEPIHLYIFELSPYKHPTGSTLPEVA